MIGVAFVQGSLGVGGAERLVQGLVRGLDPARFRPIVVNLNGPGPIGSVLAAEGHTVVSGLATSRFDPLVAARLSRVFRSNEVQVAYVIDSPLPMFWIGLHRRFTARPRVVLGYHTTGRSGGAARHTLARATAVGVADRIVALAESHRTYLARDLGLPASRFEVISSGVDLQRFDPTVSRDEARLRAGLPAGVPLAGIIAALRPEKNHGLFLRAARRVLERVPDARFVIAGDGPERTRIEQEIERLGLAGRVLVLGSRQDVPDLYRALDVAVLSSHPVVETLPVTLMEAAATGTPAVATAVGSVEDVIADGETGYVVPPGDEAALAERVQELLADPARRDRMGRAARARAERAFDERDMLRRYADLFSAVTKGAR
jgi:glycosyltransferase involved in cell wall biosynthesis